MLWESVATARSLGDIWVLMHNLIHLADAAEAFAAHRRAGLLYGAADALVERTGALILPAWQELSDRYQAEAIATAGLETFNEFRFEGRQLPLADVIKLAAQMRRH